MKSSPLASPIVVYAIVGIAGYYLVVKPLLESFNIMDTKEEKDAARLRNQTENSNFKSDYWNPNYTASKKGFRAYLLTANDATILAKRLWAASGVFNDDEDKIYGVFRELRYKTQVSYLAYYFNKLYKKDLYTWLRDSVLSDTELNTVLTITNKLPEGFVK